MTGLGHYKYAWVQVNEATQKGAQALPRGHPRLREMGRRWRPKHGWPGTQSPGRAPRGAGGLSLLLHPRTQG